MVDSNKSKNSIYETNLTNVGFANLARTMIWCPVLILDLKSFSDSEGFIFPGTIFHNFPFRFIMDSVPKKTVREFLVGRWRPSVSS